MMIESYSTSTANKIKVENNNIYVFLTSDGRQGIVRTYDFGQQAVELAPALIRLEAGGNTAKIDIKVLAK